MKATANDLEFIPIHALDRAGQLDILRIRNQEPVRNNMYTNHTITEDEHFRWIESLKTSAQVRFFAVRHEGQVIGGISLSAISEKNKRADWAYYLDVSTQGKGLGAALEFKFLDYAFGEAGLEKLNCEVLDFNEKVVSIHQKFGFVVEGERRDHIRRDGETFNAVFLGIRKREWLERRPELEQKLFSGGSNASVPPLARKAQ